MTMIAFLASVGDNAKGEIAHGWCVREGCGCKHSSNSYGVHLEHQHQVLNIANKKLLAGREREKKLPQNPCCMLVNKTVNLFIYF